MNNKKKTFFQVLAIITFLIAGFIFSSCESSRVGPQLPTPNPPAPPAQPLVLKGNVFDSKTNGAISGAAVQILKQDGSSVASVATDAAGAFSYDITTLNQAVLKVTATASGYGFSFVYANIDLTNKAAEIVRIPIDKIQTTTVNLTPTGGTATVPSNESVSGQNVALTFPPNAVTTNTTVSVAQVAVNNVPPPTNAAASTQVGVATLQPVGITFAQPVRLTFPLPFEFNAGEQIPIQELVNNVWTATTLNAVVDNTLLLANVNITKTSQYSLVDNTVVSGTATGSILPYDNKSFEVKLNKILEDRQYTFSSGTLNITDLTGSKVWTVTKTKKGNLNLPSDSWIANTFKQRFGVDAFEGFTGISATTTFPVSFSVPWPGIPPKAADQTTGAGNVDYPGVSGSWSVRVTVSSTSTTTVNVSIENARWKISVTGVTNSWQITKREWVWTGHNQGSVYYNF
jgi:hypothetical protein